MTSFLKYRVLLATVITLCLALTIRPGMVDANEVGMRITPNIIELHPTENGILEKTLTVENRGRDPLTIQILIKAFTTDKKGNILYLNRSEISSETEKFVSENIEILENNVPVTELSLSPGQKEQLLLKVTASDITNFTQHTASLFFLSKNSRESLPHDDSDTSLTTEMNISVGSAVHIILFGQKNKEEDAFTVTAFRSESFLQKGPVRFTATVRNDSDKYINIYGNISIHNMFGQRIGKILLPNQLIPSHAEKEVTGRSESSEPGISWNEGFLIGGYRARITILTDSGSEEYRERDFFVFPIRAVILILIALLIASFLIGQVREKIK
ncbi:MAG: hypothetical protein RLZZ455_589 [Candidatus Parcubacteria bacterium]|jgi:hypothetical protein